MAPAEGCVGVFRDCRLTPLPSSARHPAGRPEQSMARFPSAAKRTVDGEDGQRTIRADGKGWRFHPLKTLNSPFCKEGIPAPGAGFDYGGSEGDPLLAKGGVAA